LAADRLATSEFFEQLIEDPSRDQPRVKGSQCYTKYLWRYARLARLGSPICDC
jgi:hypothetical protein